MVPTHPEIDEAQAGTMLGPFELVTPIGQGGMARVWAARVHGTTPPGTPLPLAAVKVLLPGIAENVAFQQMFLDEAAIASRVRHRNVCATYEMGQHFSTLYLAMEWVDGPSLMHVLRPGSASTDEEEEAGRIPIQPRLAARIVADACAGLHAAHDLVGDDGRALGVVHRDVSPHNVLLTSDGIVKITDFGVAKALGKSHMTIAGQLKGKLAYMSPEQLMGSNVDRRADVFALGCVLYEITTGKRPFTGEHDPQVMAAIMIGRYDLPTDVVPGFPPELETIITMALASEPDDRFSSAEHMRQALEAYLRASGPPVTHMQVADLLRERCGSEIDARARSLFSPEVTKPRLSPVPKSGKSPRDSAPGSRSEPRLAGWGAIAVAALVGAVLGLGVLMYVHNARVNRGQRALAERGAIGEDASGIDVLPPQTSAEDIELPDDLPVVARPNARVVRLHITPPTAVLVVDGVVLPRGATAVAKPEDHHAVNVLVRADKHEDTIVLVDDETPDDVDVTLVPVVRRAAPPVVVLADAGDPSAPKPVALPVPREIPAPSDAP